MSWVSVSLVEVHLRVVSFVIFASWRFPGHPCPVTAATPLQLTGQRGS
jgi:hypothetical protein